MSRRIVFGCIGIALLGAGVFLGRLTLGPRPEKQKPGKFPETLVFVRSKDDVVSGGVMFSPPKERSKPLAVVWVHGWGANFYLPSYVGIGRALAERGLTTISVNTRMHDLGNVEKHSFGKRVRGGGYWGVTSEDARDIAAWISLAEQLGFSSVVLVGHSAGWASVGRYQAESDDKRVAGLVFASGAVGYSAQEDDPEVFAQAKKLVADGAGDGLIRLPKRFFPSYISAATHLDILSTPNEYKDFFGTQTANPAVMRVTRPMLAFYGTKGDVGNENTLNLLRSSAQRLAAGPPRISTAMIANGDHEYVGEEAQVARKVAEWAETELLNVRSTPAQ